MKNVKPVPKTTWKTQRNSVLIVQSSPLSTCMSISIRDSVSSYKGPHQQRTVLMIVKFVDVIITSLSLFLNSRYLMNLVSEKNWSINRASGVKSFFLKSTSDGWSLPDSALSLKKRHWTSRSGASERKEACYLGKRCRGHGMKRNSCGTDSRKLIIWGIKNNSMVLLKWPMIPTTAKVIPAK